MSIHSYAVPELPHGTVAGPALCAYRYYSISRYTGYIRMLGPSVFPDSRVLKMLGPSVFPDSRVLKMLGPSVFPEKRVIPEWLVLQYFQIHRLKNQVLRPKMDFVGLISSPKQLLSLSLYIYIYILDIL